MREPKFTPGPWRAGHLIDDQHTCNCRYIFGNDGRMGAVGEVYLDDGKNDCPPIAEAKENLRLISAAPELLTAAHQLMAACETSPCFATHYEDEKSAMVRMRAAIEEAEGDAP